MLHLGWLCEGMHAAVAWLVPFEPFLTRTEVCKVGVTHYMSMDEARDELGYHPVLTQQQAIKRSAAFYLPVAW
jgi:hypothetical protein